MPRLSIILGVEEAGEESKGAGVERANTTKRCELFVTALVSKLDLTP